jgi:methylated-DNA-[protein]-cysteine S-methyltransferase
MKNYAIFQTPIGKITVAENGRAITNLLFAGEKPKPDWTEQETDLLKKAGAQLAEYFAFERREFDLPLETEGTPFQRSVWDALQDIPYGETRSYGQVAAAIGNPKASRAVGMANHNNPISIIIPCHRVIGANGSLVGFGGGLDVKDYLLTLERKNSETV